MHCDCTRQYRYLCKKFSCFCEIVSFYLAVLHFTILQYNKGCSLVVHSQLDDVYLILQNRCQIKMNMVDTRQLFVFLATKLDADIQLLVPYIVCFCHQ